MSFGGQLKEGKPLPKRPTMRDVRRLLARSVEDVRREVTPSHMKTPCVIWQGAKDGKQYGYIKLHGAKRWVHRVSYEAFVGPVPEKLEIDHLCFVHDCINPEHLMPRTHEENSRRKSPEPEPIPQSPVTVGGGDDFVPF